MSWRLAVRKIAREPVAFLAVVLAIGVSIAVNGALFSIIDGRMFRPLPFEDAERLVHVDYRQAGGRLAELAYLPALAARRGQLRDELERSPLIAGAAQSGAAAFFDPGEARDLGVRAQGVDARFFRLFGFAAALGATLSVEDERSPAALSRQAPDPLPVVMGHDLWQRLYGEDPGVLGGLRTLAGRSVRVVGILPAGVKFPGETNVWAPVPSTRARVPAYVRLAPGATVNELASGFSDLTFTPLRETVYPGENVALLLLFGAAGCLLVITWAHAAALTVSASVTELHELRVRVALGARRADLLRLGAARGAMTAGGALLVGWLAVGPLTTFLVAMLPAEVRYGQYLEPDLRTFLFACSIALVGVGLLTATSFGIARHATRSASAAAWGSRSDRVRQVVLMGQMALTAFLLYLSGLAIHSYVRAARFDYGFDAEHVLLFDPPPWARLGATDQELHAAFAARNFRVEESIEALRAVPGVIGVAGLSAVPLGVGLPQDLLAIEEVDGLMRADLTARINWVSAEFLDALGATLVSGRSFDAPEHRGNQNVAVINEALARRIAPAARVAGGDLAPSSIGRELGIPLRRVRIIGVIRDFVDAGPAIPPDPQLFMWNPRPGGHILAVRVGPPVDTAVAAARTTLNQVWGPLPDRQFSLMRDELRQVLIPYRSQSVLLALIAACSMPIAGIGLVGALVHGVRLRRREIAIRLALGASPARVERSVVSRSVFSVAVGLLVGGLLGTAVGSVILSQLFQVHPFDLSSALAAAAALMLLAWLAALVPARQAARIEPAVLLRDT